MSHLLCYLDQYESPLPLDKVRIVLSHASHPGNIGAAARAMKTMGLGSLYLVNPKSFPDKEAESAPPVHGIYSIMQSLRESRRGFERHGSGSGNYRSPTRSFA